MLLTSSCALMSEEQKMVELRRAGEQGAEAHVTLLAELTVPTPEACLNNLKRFTGGAPWDEPYSSTIDWISLHGDYFVDSCVSGKPRVPDQADLRRGQSGSFRRGRRSKRNVPAPQLLPLSGIGPDARSWGLAEPTPPGTGDTSTISTSAVRHERMVTSAGR